MRTCCRPTLALSLLWLIAEPGWAEPQPYTLQWTAGQQVVFSETWQGQGRLVRGTGEGAVELPLDGAGQAQRIWTVVEVGADETSLSQAMADCGATLTMPAGKYIDDRTWRAFDLVVKPGGRIVDSTVLPGPEADEPPPDDPFARLPFDLDLGELFCVLELGLLPPKALDVGQTWEQPAPEGGGLSAKGRLVSLDESDAGPIAVLETRYACPVPERPTPVDEVVATGTLTGRTTVRFEVDSGQVRSATGPLELRLEFRRKGTAETLGTVALDLALTATRATR